MSYLLRTISCLSLVVALSSCADHKQKATPAKKHLINDFPVYTKDSLINVLVEIPAGTLEKWEVEKKSGELQLTKINNQNRIVQYLPYPGNYGLIPQTLLPKENGGDGDPLDVIVLGESVARGSLVPVKLIGVLEMLDNGEQDDKLIAVSSTSPMKDIHNIDELNQKFIGASEIIRTWFANYKGPGVVTIKGYAPPARAKHILSQSMSGYLQSRK